MIAAAQFKIDFILRDEPLSRRINRLRCSVGLERTLQGQQIMLQTLHVVPAASGGILFIRALQVGLKLDDHTIPLSRVGDQVENLRNLVRETHSAVPDRLNAVHVIAVSIAQPVCHFTAFKEVHHIKVILRHVASSVQQFTDAFCCLHPGYGHCAFSLCGIAVSKANAVGVPPCGDLLTVNDDTSAAGAELALQKLCAFLNREILLEVGNDSGSAVSAVTALRENVIHMFLRHGEGDRAEHGKLLGSPGNRNGAGRVARLHGNMNLLGFSAYT